MNIEQRAEFLKDEYIMLQQFYEDIDEKGLTIKNWAITVALAAIGTGIVYRREVLLVSFFASLVFWYLEAHWRGLSHFFSARIKVIEAAFQTKEWKEEAPLQVYATWEEEYRKSKDQTLRYMFKRTSLLPHTLIAAVSLLLYFLF
ncbi:MAG TPA: hypothetical protein VFQ13_03095 [Anaerolineales bacterium]|nr:hypothetical protein [Anaerolineales bacterium]